MRCSGADEAHLHSECICVSRDYARGLIWGIDNCYWEGDGSLIYGLSELLPLEQLEFEGIAYRLLRTLSGVLRRSYGDYLALPEDIHSHYEHVSKTKLASEAVKNSIGSICNSLLRLIVEAFLHCGTLIGTAHRITFTEAHNVD